MLLFLLSTDWAADITTSRWGQSSLDAAQTVPKWFEETIPDNSRPLQLSVGEPGCESRDEFRSEDTCLSDI